MLHARTVSPSSRTTSRTMNTVLLPVLLCFFLRPAVLRLLAELLRAVVLLLPEERLPAVLRLWVLRFWPCFVRWRASQSRA